MSITKFGTKSTHSKQGARGIGFKLTETGDYDIQNKRLVNVGNAIAPTDAVSSVSLQKLLQETIIETMQTVVVNTNDSFNNIDSKIENMSDEIILLKATMAKLNQSIMNINNKLYNVN